MKSNFEYGIELSKTQLFLLTQSISEENEKWCYHTQFSYHLEILHLALPLFLKSVKTVLDRHPVIKTVFVQTKDGYRQFVNPELGVKINYEDISELEDVQKDQFIEELLLADRNNPFDIFKTSEPLFRCYIVKRGSENLQFILCSHHAIWDGWSLAVFLKEIFFYYHQLLKKPLLRLNPARYDYTDFVKHEMDVIASPESKMFWLEQLMHHEPFRPKFGEGIHNYEQYKPIVRFLEDETLEDLNRVQQQLKVSLKSLFVGAYMRLIQDETNNIYSTIGVVTNGRSVNLKNPLTTLGLLWNFTPICVSKIEDEFDHINTVNQTLASCAAHGSYPLMNILEDKGVSELFHAAFNFINFEGANLLAKDSDIEFLTVEGLDKFHFPLHFLVGKNPFNKKISFTVNYDTRCYKEKEINQKIDFYIHYLEKISKSKKWLL